MIPVVLLGVAGLWTGSAVAQESRVILDLHGGLDVPTFDFADVRDPGPAVGGGVWYSLGQGHWQVGVESDVGFHGKDKGVTHLLVRAGYVFQPSDGGRTRLMLNAGTGLIRIRRPEISIPSFGVHVRARTDNEFGVNGGAKLMYGLTSGVDLVLSLQGDVAIRGDAYDPWVWPVSAGLRIRL
jgi:hypothetical protein